mgnify:FL=1
MKNRISASNIVALSDNMRELLKAEQKFSSAADLADALHRNTGVFLKPHQVYTLFKAVPNGRDLMKRKKRLDEVGSRIAFRDRIARLEKDVRHLQEVMTSIVTQLTKEKLHEVA